MGSDAGVGSVAAVREEDDQQLELECLAIELDTRIYSLQAQLSKQRVLLHQWEEAAAAAPSGERAALEPTLEEARRSVLSMEKRIAAMETQRAGLVLDDDDDDGDSDDDDDGD